MNKIEKLIQENQGGVVLFLGRVTNFTAEELSNFLEAQGMEYSDKYTGQEVAITVLSTMLTPLEDDYSFTLYDLKVPELRLEEFEEYYTTHIKPNTLMMSLKLSNDQERLKRMLKNEAFVDDVYLKLFKMYDWGSEGVYENDENRDTTITFVKRFFRPDGFRDPAMVYSPITLSSIARDTKDENVLDAMLSMPNHEIKQSRKEDLRPKNLRELVALNSAVSREIIRYLLSFNDDRINSFLACNNAIGLKEQEHIAQKADDVTKLMLTQNNSLDDSIFRTLLEDVDEVVASLLTYQTLNEERLEMIFAQDLKDELLSYMGENQSIEAISEKLVEINEDLDFKLASNFKVSNKLLDNIYKTYGDKVMVELSSNPNLSIDLIESFYKSNVKEVLENLAGNITTPKVILKELCERNEHNLNRELALNPSVDLEYLEMFALDNELHQIMASNQTYLDSIVHK